MGRKLACNCETCPADLFDKDDIKGLLDYAIMDTRDNASDWVVPAVWDAWIVEDSPSWEVCVCVHRLSNGQLDENITIAYKCSQCREFVDELAEESGVCDACTDAGYEKYRLR